MLMFAYVIPNLPPLVEAVIDVLILVLTIIPAIYYGVINPFIVANNDLIDRVNSLAFLDELTQLRNRRALYEHFKMFLSMNMRHKTYGAVLFLDLDMFKEINDRFGHDVGDAVLVETAKRLSDIVRKENVVCRVGGDEFIILCDTNTSDRKNALDQALLISERILDSLKVPVQFNQKFLTVGASIGIKLVAPEPHSINVILKHADQAMYQAKNSKDEKICVFE